MPQSLSMILLHLIFSTKNRAPLISEPVRPRMHAYLATVTRDLGCECYRAGGAADHVHLAIRLSRTITIATLVEEIKTASSRWAKTDGVGIAGFTWQRGYACFSVGPSDLRALLAYIDAQETHHKSRSFQDELRTFLRKYGISFDEAYIWD